jgi:serine protease Do
MKRINVQVWLTAVLLLSMLTLTGCGSATTLLKSMSVRAEAARATATQMPAAQVTSAPAASQASPETPATSLQTASADALLALQGQLEQIYTQVSPSVVNVQVTVKATAVSGNMPTFPGFPFPFTPQVPQGPQVQHGLGSGFVWDKDGHIVTNNHVVAEADTIEVVFSDGEAVPATVVGTDVDSDLAVLKVDMSPDKLQPVQLADSAQLKVGQLAIAIGDPFGLEGTMTLGIISALGRSLPVASDGSQGARYTIPDIIQTDAPINPGNSGGVLVNDRGQVIGVTAAIESPVQANAGIGFAIPSAIVHKVVPSLIETGTYAHPWLGISGTTLNTELNTAMKLDAGQRGALVEEVIPGGPADVAGLQGSDRQIEIEGHPVQVGGDVIVSIEGQPVKSFEDLVAYLVGHTDVGQTVHLGVLRNGRTQDVALKLAARPKAEAAQAASPESGVAQGAWLGISGITLTPELAGAMQLPTGQEGVLVQQVTPGSPADEANLRASTTAEVVNGQTVMVGGDVVVGIDAAPIATIEELLSYLGQAQSGQRVTLTLLRDRQELQVRVVLAERPFGFSVPD